MSFQAEKKTVLEYFNALEASRYTDDQIIHQFTAADYCWRGYYPFNLLCRDTLTPQFWHPLSHALSHLQRRQDIFFAGANQLDGFQSTWVVSMGHWLGLFDKPWLGIQPTGKMAFLRYAEFHRVVNSKITETACYIDIPHLMAQAGASPFTSQTAQHLVQPGPATHDGLMFEPQATAAGEATLAKINSMISNLGQWQNPLPLEEELRQDWHEDMIWWGPEGIGSTYTIERYAEQHSRPFRAAFSERSQTNHICRLAEGHYGGFFGWPNFTATLSGSFMGHTATNKPADFRVVDIYRRKENKLAENWVFIDLPYFWKQQGIDVLPETDQ